MQSEFMSACSDCQIDAVAAHWYDSSDNAAYFYLYMGWLKGNFSVPIWLTEVCTGVKQRRGLR